MAENQVGANPRHREMDGQPFWRAALDGEDKR